jgi:hypothetical protein
MQVSFAKPLTVKNMINVILPQFFDFHTAVLEHTLLLPSSALSIMLQRDSGLLAVICDDLAIRIVDIETRRIVRELRGFSGKILDIVGFSTPSYGRFFLQCL